ncbi:MAG: PadR family transcriptional regulator [Propionibacteriaceae bacterium]|nr:PadR family transcriptional regulator [Propionibacteriaceae bacterium]
MDTKHALLGLVGAGSEYGYDLKHNYDRWFHTSKPLAYGQVYSTLARLLRAGLILALGAEAGAGPDRKRYEITPAGRAAVAEWMFAPEPPTNALRPDLFAKTIIALLLDEDAERLLDLQRAAHRERMREITRTKRGADLRTLLLADHALFHLEADLRWIDLTAARLTQLREEVTK